MTRDTPALRAAGFGKALARLAREAATAPEGRLHVATCRLPPPTELLRLWDVGPPRQFAAFWEDEREAMAGIGATARGSSPESGSGAETPRWFGGVPFAHDWTDDDWQPLTDAGFVLPRWTLHRAGEDESLKVTLAIRGPLRRSELDAISSEFEEIVETVVGEPSPPARAPVAPPARSGADAPDTDDEPRRGGPPDASFARAVWRGAVEAALSEIEAGRLEKVVLARRVAQPLPPRANDPVEVLRRLRAERSGRFRFGLREAGRAFVGASPECLFRKKGTILAVEALAGTYDLAGDPDADLVQAAEHLFASGKDLAEHALVVQGVVDSLEPLAVSVQPDEWPQVRGARRLAHLSTTVRAHLHPGVSPLELVDALHPTPAVGGLPRDAALEFIRGTEPAPRGLFAAPVGWVSPDGSACLAVGIRSALLLKTHAWIYAGAGIVGGSDPDSEWRETAAKMRWFRELLAGDPKA